MVSAPPVWQGSVGLLRGVDSKYETMSWVDVEERPTVQESIKTRSVLELREMEKQLQQQLYTGKLWKKMEWELSCGWWSQVGWVVSVLPRNH